MSSRRALRSAVLLSLSLALPASALASDGQAAGPPARETAKPAERPAFLVSMYASFAALESLDVHSTLRAIRRGGVEGNPLMKGIAGQPAALVALKAGVTGGVIWGAEKLRKRNRAAAVALMVGANAALAAVVARNYRAAR